MTLGPGAELLAGAGRKRDHMQFGPIDLRHGAPDADRIAAEWQPIYARSVGEIRRRSSGGVIQHASAGRDIVPEVPAQVGRGAQVDLSPE
jgi:hypothetical protein